MSKKALIAIGVIIAVLAIDQALKVWVKTSFDPGEIQNFVGSFLRLHYIENDGMAFGTKLGNGDWAKLALSVFRIVAILGIAFYLYYIIKKKEATVYIASIAMIWAGAAGNLIDCLFYDLIFDPVCYFDCNYNLPNCYDHVNVIDDMNCRTRGFLHGNVVDMFQFNAKWPWSGGGQIFPAIFNFADAAITIGVALIILNYKKFLGSGSGKNKKEEKTES